MSDTPRTDAAEKEAIDDTGAITRMEPIWETMVALERENTRMREALMKIVNNDPEANRQHADEIASVVLAIRGAREAE